MTTSPNKMSEEELLRCIKNITFDVWEDNVSYDVAAELVLHLIKQHREGYALDLIGDDEKVPESIFEYGDDDQRKYWYNKLRAELREKVGRDDNK